MRPTVLKHGGILALCAREAELLSRSGIPVVKEWG
jgi:hypothetical protein